MNGFDRFLKEIGAITASEGTSADDAVAEVIKNLRAYLQQMVSRSPDFSQSMDFHLVQESLNKADANVQEGDFKRASLDTLNAMLHLGYAARSAATVEDLEAVLNKAYEQAQQSVS